MVKTFEINFVQNPYEDFEINLPEKIITDVELIEAFATDWFTIYQINTHLNLPKPINTSVIIGWLPVDEGTWYFSPEQYLGDEATPFTILFHEDIYDYNNQFDNIEKIEINLYPVFDFTPKISLSVQWSQF